MDRGAWWATVHGVAKSQTQLSDLIINWSIHFKCMYNWTKSQYYCYKIKTAPPWVFLFRGPMAPHSSTLAWKIPWTEESGGLQSMGLLESDTTERLHFHLSLSCIGEGNGNPLQCSCLENPRDGGACWAAISGVAQSRTRLKWLSSSSSKELWCSRTQRLGFQHWVTGFDLGQVDFPSGFQFPHLKNVGVGFSPLHSVVLEVGGLYNWHSNLHGLVKHFGMSFQCCSWELV